MTSYRKIALLLLVSLLFSCAGRPPVLDREPEKPAPDYLTIIAAGDNLYHTPMIKDGEEGDYETSYREIRSLVKDADIAFINQETLLGGKAFGFSGYPQFNSPQQLGRAIAALGFDVVNHANNHVMDKGEKAVITTLDFWEAFPGVKILGIHRSKEQRRRPVLVKKNNITVGFLAYTYGTNGIPVPGDKPYLVSLANTGVMSEEIDAIRPLCDVLVVSMHWGDEYQHMYNKTQENLAAFLAEHQVDLVIGHHPHVIQPVEHIQRPDGKSMVCFYSLGNLLSAQTQTPTFPGAMAYIRIKKDGEDAFVFEEVGAIPLVNHYEKDYSVFTVYPLYAYTEELMNKHWKNQWKKEVTIDSMKSLTAKVFGDKEIKYNPFR